MNPGQRTRAALLAAVALAAVAAAANEPSRERGPLPPDRALTREEARSPDRLATARFEDGRLGAALTDGDDATAADRQDDVAARLAGGADWVNEVEIRYRGAVAIVIDLLPPERGASPVTVRRALPPAADWSSAVLPVPAGRYQALTVRVAPERGAGVAELKAFWFEEELLRDAAETADEWCEDYPGSGNDLSAPSETAQRFSDYLRDHGWTWKFSYGNASAWEEDFKRHDLGGTNNSYLDATDAFIYCGHGTTDATFMADTSHDDSAVSAGDINGAWGDTDLEWAFFHCCLNLSSTAWHSALAGTHTIAGAINVINSSSNYGKSIAKKLIDNGAFDSPWSIYSSWWHANDANQPAGNRFRMLAEDTGHYNEMVWGEGTVLDDSDDATHWTVSHTVSKVAGGRGVFDPEAVQRTSEPIAWNPPPGLGEPGRPALTVRVHPEVLQKSLPQVAWMFDVLPSGMDDGTALQMLERLCGYLDLDCAGAEVGREDGEGYAVAAGLASLGGDIASGGWQFTDLGAHVVPAERPDGSVNPGEAAERALQFLSALDLIDESSFLGDVHTFEVAEIDSNGEVLQSFPFMHDVVIGRMRGPQAEALPAVGNGGRTHVAVGLDGSIQAFSQVSRRVQPRAAVDVIGVDAALNHLAAFGYAALQSPPEFPADEVDVRDLNLGYFEQGIAAQQTSMGPVYYLDVDLTGPDPRQEGGRTTVPARLFLAADTLPVRAEILAPGDGESFAFGEMIAFRSAALFGTPPYQFRWFSDLHGLISSEQNFQTDQLNPGFREDGTPSPLTIQLQITDATGYTATDQIALIITGVVGVGDVPLAFALAPASPNPFNPRTTIAFAAPDPGHATLRVMDLRGRVIDTLVDEVVAAGRHARVWDGTDASGRPVAAGVYLYRLDLRAADGTMRTDTRRMVLVR